MIKKASLMTALSVTAFSGWAQDSGPDTLVVTANRFQQPVNTVLAPTEVVTKADIDKWQSKTILDVMRRLPGVDIAQNGGMGQSSSLFVRGTEARHVLVLVDGIPLARPGISNSSDIDQIPVSLVQRIEYIRGPRSAVYGSGAIGGVVNIITPASSSGAALNTGLTTILPASSVAMATPTMPTTIREATAMTAAVTSISSITSPGIPGCALIPASIPHS